MPVKSSNMGYIILSNDEVIFFGGHADGTLTIRDSVYLLDIQKREIIKTSKTLAKKDMF